MRELDRYWSPMLEDSLMAENPFLKDLPKRKITVMQRIKWKVTATIVGCCEWIIRKLGY